MKLTMLTLLFFLAGCYEVKNFHEVDSGKFYRSAQLNGKEFEMAIKKLGIKTIINLRGESEKDWFKEESEVAERYGVKHINIRMTARKIPHKENLIKLLEAYRDAPRPILIHCQAGADRTGEASAIYAMLYMGKTKKEAMELQTIRYLHLEQKYPAKRYFIGKLWQGEEWAYNEYDPCSGEYEHYTVENNPFCRVEESESIGREEELEVEDDT